MGVFLSYAPNGSFLFQGPPLRDNLINGAQQAFDRLQGWNPDALLNAAETDIIDELLNTATFEIPDIDQHGAHLDDPTEVIQELHSAGSGLRQIVTRQTLIVPISGPVVFFQLTALTTSIGNPIAAEFDLNDPPKLLLHSTGIDDAAQIKAHFQDQLERIQKQLVWTQADIKAHNEAMKAEIPAKVAARRTKLLHDRNIQASIGFPIKKRAAADTYSVPLTRRTIRPHRAATSTPANPYTPEPALADADYEAALAVLHRARNALERSRSMTSKMDEEEIRDLLLVMLNDHFEGQAGGEVFNCTGKTDILIREQDRHVFIAECKVYAPKNKKSVEGVITDALDQLLRYLTWRDTKAALLLFVRDTDLTNVMNKAIATIKQHPNYKRDGSITNEQRHDVIHYANGDRNREIQLAFLPFHVGGKHDQPAD
jgi:hypothetical protein